MPYQVVRRGVGSQTSWGSLSQLRSAVLKISDVRWLAQPYACSLSAGRALPQVALQMPHEPHRPASVCARTCVPGPRRAPAAHAAPSLTCDRDGSIARQICVPAGHLIAGGELLRRPIRLLLRDISGRGHRQQPTTHGAQHTDLDVHLSLRREDLP